MRYTTPLAVGAKVIWEGECWTVDGFVDDSVRLSSLGRSAVLRLSALIGAPGFRVASDLTTPEKALAPILDKLTREEFRQIGDLAGHLAEVVTGYRAENDDRALPGEPRHAYAPGVPMMTRYAAKAEELGLSVTTVRRLVAHWKARDFAAMIDGRKHRAHRSLGRVDERWVNAALEVIAEHKDLSQPTHLAIIDATNRRVRAEHGAAVRLPSEATARRVLSALTKGQQVFSGTSAKQKRSIAAVPKMSYSQLGAYRIGQYVMLDSTSLDVFAMDPITLKWIAVNLSIVIDVATRCIIAIRLSPSAKSIDTAILLFEAISPVSRSHTSIGLLPYGGVPDAIVDGITEYATIDVSLPGAALETVIMDHGRNYINRHILVACDRLGINVQPARIATPTDKSIVERFFRTLREDLLERLPGYKGPDVYSRGKDVEDLAYYFIDELEQVIREWIVTRYHTRQHDGLRDGRTGITYTPSEMWAKLASQFGVITVPRWTDIAYELLPMKWLTIHHYGIQLHGLRYDAACLDKYRRHKCSYYKHGKGLWPISYDPDDISYVLFNDPADGRWHRLRWIGADDVQVPFSLDALSYAKRLARDEGRVPDAREALEDLLARWDRGQVESRRERRMAIRLSEQRAARLTASDDGPDALPPSATPWADDGASLMDDADPESGDPDDYYRDALEVGE